MYFSIPHRTLSLLALLALPAAAHDLWLERDAAGWTLLLGHRHSAHDGADTLPYAAGLVRAATCIEAEGRRRALPTGATPWRTTATDCALLRLDLSSGYWSKTPWETKNVPKSEAPGALRSWLSEESLKFLARWTAAARTPLGQGLEITPLSDPTSLAVGDKFTVLVSLDGRPWANAPVALNGETRGESDAAGRINLRLRRIGLQLVSTSAETPLADGKADWHLRAASLQFETRR